MVKEVGPVEFNKEELANKVFMKVIELLGGLEKLAEFKTLTWLPSLARAVLAVIYKEEYGKVNAEIAAELGLTAQTVSKMVSAKPKEAIKKLKSVLKSEEEADETTKVHIAGGLARAAYQLVKKEED